jgi:hypothetical protein
MFWIEIKDGILCFRVWNYEDLDFEEYGSMSLWDIYTNLHHTFLGLNN